MLIINSVASTIGALALAFSALVQVTHAKDVYIDCSATAAGSGTKKSPYNALASVNALNFTAGDEILLKSGTLCNGTLSPQGNGALSKPVLISSYGSGALPIINGQGGEAAIKLLNQGGWHITKVAVTNPASTVNARQGISITANDNQTHSGIFVDHVSVYDVAGQTNKATQSESYIVSAGILVDGSNFTSRFNDVYVSSNNIQNCGGGGIKVRMGQMNNQGQNGHVWNNKIENIGGDGIVMSYVDSPLIDHNECSGLGSGHYPWTGGNFAGIWVLGCHNAVMEYNIVHNTLMSAFDSEAFDCDWGNTGNCTVQYNYGHDNAGGMFLNCDGCGTSGGANQFVRYNVFQNDCRMYSNGDIPTLWFYNNVVYCPNQHFNLTVPPKSHFWNNIFVGTADSVLPTGSGIDWSYNIFETVPSPTNGTNNTVGDPGFVAPGTGGNTTASVAGYKLKRGSIALGNGGVVTNNGGLDFWGNIVSATAKPNRGAYNGPAIKSSKHRRH